MSIVTLIAILPSISQASTQQSKSSCKHRSRKVLMTDIQGEIAPKQKKHLGSKILFFLLALVCFAFLFYRLNGAAAREGLTLVAYMEKIFAAIDWRRWLLLMVAYSAFYFLVDTMVTWCVINWFIAKV